MFSKTSSKITSPSGGSSKYNPYDTQPASMYWEYSNQESLEKSKNLQGEISRRRQSAIDFAPILLMQAP